MPIFTQTPASQPVATHFILVQAGCGVVCVPSPSHNIQNITKYAAPNKEISWARAGMLCSNSAALGYLSGGHLIT